MSQPYEPAQSLTALIDRIAESADGSDPTIGQMLAAAGGRSIGPVLFVPALIAASPIGAIPGMSIAMGSVIILFAVQLTFGSRHLWTPKVIANREVDRAKVRTGAEKARKPAAWLDRHLGGRWGWATNETGQFVVGIIACLLGASMYPLAFVPFGVFLPSGALVLLSAGLMTRDGVLIALGGAIALGAAVAVGYWAVGAAL